MACFIIPGLNYGYRSIVWFRVGNQVVACHSYDAENQQLLEIEKKDFGKLSKDISGLRGLKIVNSRIKLPNRECRSMLVVENEKMLEKLEDLQKIFPFAERQCVKDFRAALKKQLNSEVCLEFIKMFPDSLEESDDGITLLNLAVEAGNLRCVNQLRRLGVDVDSKDKSGFSPAELAYSKFQKQFFKKNQDDNQAIRTSADQADKLPIDCKANRKRRSIESYSGNNPFKLLLADTVRVLGDDGMKLFAERARTFDDTKRRAKIQKYEAAWRNGFFAADVSNAQQNNSYQCLPSFPSASDAELCEYQEEQFSNSESERRASNFDPPQDTPQVSFDKKDEITDKPPASPKSPLFDDDGFNMYAVFDPEYGSRNNFLQTLDYVPPSPPYLGIEVDLKRNDDTESPLRDINSELDSLPSALSYN